MMINRRGSSPELQTIAFFVEEIGEYAERELNRLRGRTACFFALGLDLCGIADPQLETQFH
jgi:hypothetical protein